MSLADELQGILRKDMRLKGFCLAPVEAQRASAKPYVLDPDVVSFDPDRAYPLLEEFRGEPLGTARVQRLAGGLMVEAELATDLPDGVCYFAIGGFGKQHIDGDKVRVWDSVEIENIALTHMNADPGLAPFEIEP